MILYFICGQGNLICFCQSDQHAWLAMVIGDWPIPDYTQYIAQRITDRGGLTLSAPVDALSFGRLFTPSAFVDVVFLDGQHSSLLPS